MEWKKHYPKILLGIYVIFWIWAAIEPNYRSVWISENILPVLFALVLIVSYKWFKFSNASYTFIFIFMILHAIGGHYSYVEMPVFTYLKSMFSLERNYYDRLVHFLFGSLFFYPIYEIMRRIFRVPEGWRGLFFTFFVIAALKGIFEILEYGYVWIKADPLTVSNYLGEQGDSWDSQKDILMGILGAGFSWLILGIKSAIGQSHKF